MKRRTCIVARELMHGLKNIQASAVLAEIEACKETIVEITEQNRVKEESNILRFQYFMHTLRVFQAEFYAYLKEWDNLSQLVEVSSTVCARRNLWKIMCRK
jgi:hypothetical protein